MKSLNSGVCCTLGLKRKNEKEWGTDGMTEALEAKLVPWGYSRNFRARSYDASEFYGRQPREYLFVIKSSHQGDVTLGLQVPRPLDFCSTGHPTGIAHSYEDFGK